MDKSEEKVEESRKNGHRMLNDNQNNNDQSGNEQYLILNTDATTICITLNIKLENEKKVNNSMEVQSCT